MEHIRARDRLFICGLVKIRQIPPISLEDYRAWWPRLSSEERDRYTVAEFENLITTAGYSALLSYCSSGLSTAIGFAQYFAVGTGTLYSVSPSDTILATELFRAAPSSTTITGNQGEISTLFSTSQGNGAWTNAGLFGGSGATSSANTGTLNTHTLYSYTKTSANAVSNDYVILLT